MLSADIHIRSFAGPGLQNYIHSIAKLRMEIFKEEPFTQEPDLYRELNRLKSYLSSKEAIGTLVFDHTTLIGVSLGIPLALESSELQKPFVDHSQPIDQYFYFSESVLLLPYRRRGIGHHFFDIREAHVKQLKQYQRICFIDPNTNHLKTNSLFLADFWKNRGYSPYSDLECSLPWQNLGEMKPSEKKCLFWVKSL